MTKHSYDFEKVCCLMDPEAPVHDMTPEPVANGGRSTLLTFAEFHRVNAERCQKNFDKHLSTWSSADWLTAVTGELGELASLLKKIRRGYDLTRGDNLAEMKAKLAAEWADVYCYLDLLASNLDITPDEAIRKKFNEVSDRVHSDIKL